MVRVGSARALGVDPAERTPEPFTSGTQLIPDLLEGCALIVILSGPEIPVRRSNEEQVRDVHRPIQLEEPVADPTEQPADVAVSPSCGTSRTWVTTAWMVYPLGRQARWVRDAGPEAHGPTESPVVKDPSSLVVRRAFDLVEF